MKESLDELKSEAKAKMHYWRNIVVALKYC